MINLFDYCNYLNKINKERIVDEYDEYIIEEPKLIVAFMNELLKSSSDIIMSHTELFTKILNRYNDSSMKKYLNKTEIKQIMKMMHTVIISL